MDLICIMSEAADQKMATAEKQHPKKQNMLHCNPVQLVSGCYCLLEAGRRGGSSIVQPDAIEN